MQMDCRSIGKRIPLVEANQFQLIAANAVPTACHPMPWPAACAKYSVALSTPLELRATKRSRKAMKQKYYISFSDRPVGPSLSITATSPGVPDLGCQ